MDEDYVRKLEGVIEQFLQPLRGLPFPLAIKALTGYQVLPFETADEHSAALLSLLAQATASATTAAEQQGVFAHIPSKAGNRMEPFLLAALRQVGLLAEVPKTRSGKSRSVGYPDIQIAYQDRVIYLDCKTYAAATQVSTMRSFYLSPSEDPKINHDAHHLLIAFEMERTAETNQAGELKFRPVSWHIYTLDKLEVSVKYEFNASNALLYRSEALLAEGKVDI